MLTRPGPKVAEDDNLVPMKALRPILFILAKPRVHGMEFST